ncbi:PQQ-dependent sugar dehydrogenase [Kiritimatiellota bacterium B12222]|nr:PQQ-dependent sugar dehydrogenase [Kiritimatiellota bacterium B12222]
MKTKISVFFCVWILASWTRADVKQTYTQYCTVCHGAKGQGGLGASFIDNEWKYGSSDEELAGIIKNGMPQLGMQAFGHTLSDEQIQALVVYIRELNTAANKPKAPEIKAGISHTQHQKYRRDVVLHNDQKMWGISFLPEGRKIITEIDGPVKIIEADGTLGPAIQGTPAVVRKGQGGMLDVAVHPDYESNGWIYLAFAEGNQNQSMTSVVRGRVKQNIWVDQELIFKAKEKFYRGSSHHFGTRIIFQDGYVFFSIGDRGASDQAQDLNRPTGKIHRVHEDGRIPEDNPFVTNSDTPSIWSYGHRNPQALVLRPGSQEIWSTEHGPRGGDELNLIRKGLNYGWPEVTFGIHYNGKPITAHTQLPGMEAPVMHWTPSIATCGMAFVDGEHYPGWAGDLLVGGLKAQVIERLRIGQHGIVEREVIMKDQGRIRDIKSSPDGMIYVILESTGSQLVRLVPVS